MLLSTTISSYQKRMVTAIDIQTAGYYQLYNAKTTSYTYTFDFHCNNFFPFAVVTLQVNMTSSRSVSFGLRVMAGSFIPSS